MTRDEMLKRIKDRLQAQHGPRLRGVVLYGSEARGQARADSDIDVLVLLKGPVDYGQDLEANLNAVYPLSVEFGKKDQHKPVPADEYDDAGCPLYQQAHAEGIAV